MHLTKNHRSAPGVWSIVNETGEVVRRLGEKDTDYESGVRALVASSAPRTITAAAEGDPYLVPWESDAICFVGVETSDSRIIDNPVSFRSFPLPVMAAFQTSWGHNGAYVVGRMDAGSNSGENVPASGHIDTLLPMGLQAARMVDTGSMNRVSIDPSGGHVEVEVTERDEDGWATEWLDHYIDLEVGGVTLVNISAFAESKMRLTGPIPGLEDTVTAAGALRSERFVSSVRPFEQQRDDHGRFGEGSGGTSAYGQSPGKDSKDPFTTPNGSTMEFHGDKDFVIRGSEGQLIGVSNGLADQHAAEISADANQWVPMQAGDKEYSALLPAAWAASAAINMHDGGELDVKMGGVAANADGSFSDFAKFDAADSFSISEMAAKNKIASAAPESMVAAASTVDPPLHFFEDPQFEGRTRLTIDEPDESGHRRVYGHLAPWKECHIGITGQCVMAPHSPSQYAWFQLGSLKCVEGCVIPIGCITFRGKHAEKHLPARGATDHYDATCMQFADIAIGEDDHGIWFSGAVRTTATDEDIREMRASRLSGDWRKVNGDLELVAAHAVNTGGFPVYEEALAADGSVQTVIASLDSEDVSAEPFVDHALRKAFAPMFAERVEKLRERMHV